MRQRRDVDGFYSPISRLAGEPRMPPRVAILSIPTGKKVCAGKNISIINEINVRWFEELGVDVIPVNFVDCDVEAVMKECSGLYLQGGPNHDARYVALVHRFMEEAMRVNWPIWGTCHGFQCMIRVLFGHLSKFNCLRYRTRLEPVPEWKRSRMLAKADNFAIEDLESADGVVFNNQYGLAVEDFYDPIADVKDIFCLVATAKDRDGKELVAAVEGKRYPFYGVQFHPEKMEGAGGIWLRKFFVGELVKNQSQSQWQRQRQIQPSLPPFGQRFTRKKCRSLRRKYGKEHATIFSGKHCYFFDSRGTRRKRGCIRPKI